MLAQERRVEVDYSTGCLENSPEYLPIVGHTADPTHASRVLG